MLKKIAFAVLLVCGAAMAQQAGTTTQPMLEPGVVYNTGNLVNWTAPNTAGATNTTSSTWINGVYQQSLTCWGPGGPGNCGPTPTVTPGSINFSYGLTDIYQVTSVAAALPNSGTGLNVNGYNFAFMAKNGNGWDNAQQDYLSAYVRFYGSNGSTVRNDYYDLNYKFDWTNFNLSKTFDTPYASKDLTAAQFGFVGGDSNFWAGTYGPEVTNISFSLKYSVDPCATNPMYSPTCPGYLDALNKLIPQTTVVADSTTTVVDPVSSTTATTISSNPTSVVASVVSAPAPTTTTSTSSSTSSVSSQSKESSSSSGSTSLALSIISKNSDRDAVGSAVAQAAVAQAQAMATQAQQEAASVAANAVANSTTVSAVTVGSQQSNGTGIKLNINTSNSTNFSLPSATTSLTSLIGGPQSGQSTFTQQQNTSNLGLNVTNNQLVITTNPSIQQSTVSEIPITYALPLLQPHQQTTTTVAPNVFSVVEQQAPQQTMLQSTSIPTQSTETYAMVQPNFLTDKSNPLTDIVEGKNTVPQNSAIATTGSSVNRNASDNEVAGGVDLNKMALAPVGYNNYLSFTLKDASFYAPKEVYKNQRNVDNARALRQLSSDSKHKEMVEMQYAR